MTVLTALMILASISLGYWLFSKYAGGANAIYDAVATASAILWVLAGIFAIMGGFVLFGSVLIVVFSYVGFSKGSLTKQRIRSRIAG